MESSSSTSSSSTRRTTSTEITSTSLMAIQNSFDSVYSRYAREALDELPGNFTITDPSIPGHPIIFASQGFLKMTGYDRDEVVGRGGAMFQGDRTSRRSLMEVREAVRNDRSCQVSLLNYRKDGTPFWMLFHVSPVFGRDGGRVVHFVAVQVPLEGRRLRRRRSIGCRRGSGDDGGSGDYVLGCCRKEVCNDNSLEVELVSSMDHGLDHDTKELDSDKPCEATDDEKRSVMVAMDNIFSVLTHYSESTGRLFSRRTNPHLPDMPIVYASDAFLNLTGYARDEVLGRNCRFLGGPDTDDSTLYLIRESIKNEQPCTVRILNYRKDRSSFWNLLHISPVRDASGKVAYYVGVQIEDECKNEDRQGLSPEKRQLSVVGVVKVAVRSLSMHAGSSKS
ncbi:protein TWIN LOV 1 isoform X2 [Arachis duranensis]|uniref:Protein TWIN LOV 1 isoform X2 n=1 Tax=Arachis duranensis TaxID=130453 RepID=A0A6P5NKK6_ARADU|nr:protein TWIN LOV 1 isoform X2 [Arachis duranensis]XP_025699186.1 protein TWIN LOV 1 isoform X2 [Arachis hypogaea]